MSMSIGPFTGSLTAVALLAAAASAEPVKFTNDGSLDWSAGGNSAHFPVYEPCDSANPVPGYRAFDLVRGVEQMAPTSANPPPKTAFCRRGYHAPTTSGDSAPRYILASGASAWAVGDILRPTNLLYYQTPTVIRPFAPGMTIGPSTTFGGGPIYAQFPSTTNGRDTLWQIAPRQFVGVRLELPDGLHYGWVLIDRSSGELVPVEWAYESLPDTPITIESTQSISSTLNTFSGAVTTIPLRSGNTAAGLHDPQIHRLLGPATGPMATPFTAANFASARAGAEAYSITPRADWYSIPGQLWTGTSPNPNTERTALFAIDFALPNDFNPAETIVEMRLGLSSADRLGPDDLSAPGVYLNGVGLPNSAGSVNHSTESIRGFVGLESIVHPGVNTLYLYNVNYGSLAPYTTGSGLRFSGELNLISRTPNTASISPAAATIEPGASLQLYGGVLSRTSPALTWSATGGAVTASGFFTAPPAPGVYTVRVASSVDPSVFAEASVTVSPVCPADFNHDSNLDPDDLGDFITCFFTDPPCTGADFNGDSNFDPDDLGDFITAFFLGC